MRIIIFNPIMKFLTEKQLHSYLLPVDFVVNGSTLKISSFSELEDDSKSNFIDGFYDKVCFHND